MTPETVLREADQKLRANDPLGAERVLAKLWADTGTAPAPALYLLGFIRLRQHRIPDAERYFRRAIAAAPGEANYHLALADLLASVGAHAHAVDAYKIAFGCRPPTPEQEMAFARSLLEAGKPAEAEATLRRLAQADAKGTIFELLSRALRSQDKLEAALEAVETALRLDPSNLGAAHGRILLLSRLGRNEEALTEIDRAEATGAAAPAFALARGAAQFSLSRGGEGLSTFEAAVRRWPQDPGLQNALANARWMRGEGEAFARDFGAAVAREPDNIQLRAMYADLLRRADFKSQSEAVLREGVARAPDQPALTASLGVLLDELDRTDEALPLLQAASARAPHITQIRANLACALLRLDRGDEALREIEPARRAEPLNQEWIGYETMALRQLGSPRYAELCDYDRMVRSYDLSPPSGYASIEAFNAALAASLAHLHVIEAHPLDQSLRGGSQTSRSLIYVDDPVIQSYLSALAEPIYAYMRAMGAADPGHPWSGRKTGRYKLSGAWSVKLKAHGYHVNHLHPAGWISSAYYVSVPKAVEQGEDQQGWIKFGEPRWATPKCTVEKVVQPKAGRLVLFPSYMWHGTIPFQEGERLTAPFDAVPA